MRPSIIGRIAGTKAFTAGVAIAAIPLFGAIPLAHADADSDYIAALSSRDIVPTNGNNAGAIENAKTACAMLQEGQSVSQVESQWAAADRGHGLSASDIDYMTHQAIKDYCPGAG